MSNVLPQTLRDGISRIISSIFSRCSIRCGISASISGLAIFAQTIKTASAAKKGTMLFAPNAFIDEWYWVQHQMLCHPGPICDPSTPAQSLQIDTGRESPSPPAGSPSSSSSLPGIVSIRMPPPQGVLPAYSENLLEPAVRIAGVLYIEALVPDEPRTLNGYAILLALVTRTIEDVMSQVRRRSASGSWHPAIHISTLDDGHPSFEAMKPIMIWVALVAYAIARVGDGELQWDSPRYDRSVYLECLSMFIGSSAEDVDNLSEADMALCEILELKALLRREVSNKDLLKEALAERTKNTKGAQVGAGDWEPAQGWVW